MLQMKSAQSRYLTICNPVRQQEIQTKLNLDALDPRLWGGHFKTMNILQYKLLKDIAPENLLKFMRCKFKLTSKNLCGSSTCSCCKNGLKCVTACGGCCGGGCNNAQKYFLVQKRIQWKK